MVFHSGDVKPITCIFNAVSLGPRPMQLICFPMVSCVLSLLNWTRESGLKCREWTKCWTDVNNNLFMSNKMRDIQNYKQTN